MPDITWADEFFPVLLRPHFIPLDVKTVLDVGCGRGLMGALLRIYREPTRIVAVDIHEPYIEFVKKMGSYDEVIKQDLSGSKLPFENNSFDLVVCLEVIEHLKKDNGLRLLSELERVGRRVIVSTPGHFFEQTQYDGNVRQEHVSLYRPKEFRALGYRVYGEGQMVLFGRPLRFVSEALAFVSRRFPGRASTLIAVKDTDQRSTKP